MLSDFAVRSHRQLRQDDNALRSLVLGERVLDERRQLGWFDCPAGDQFNERNNFLVALHRNADDGRVQDRIVRVERRLDLLRIDIEAGANNQFL